MYGTASSSSTARALDENNLPKPTRDMYRSLNGLQTGLRTACSIVEQNASRTSSHSGRQHSSHNDSSLDSLRREQQEEYRLAARHRHGGFQRPPRPEPFEVDSVSADDLIRANANAGSRRSDRSRTDDVEAVRHGEYRSSLGQRWSGAFANMEHELMLSASAAAATHGHDATAASGNTSRGPPETASSRPATANNTSVLPNANTGAAASSRPHIVAHLQAMEATASSMSSLELDALRRQSAELAHMRVQLKDEAASHNEAVAALKVEHHKEIEQLTKSFREAKERLVDETYNSRLISFNAKEELWQTELETMKMRIRDTERAHEAERLKQQGTAAELRNAMEQVQQLRGEVERLDAEVARLNTDNAVLRRERVELNHGYQERDSELRAAKHREQLLLDEGHKHQARIAQLEESMRMLDLTSKEQMRKLENEFTQTNLQFEMLLNETSEKAQKYERVKGRYKALKDAAVAKEKELEAALQHATILAKDLKIELDARDEELRNTRAAVSCKEHELREERRSHAAAIDALQDRMAEQEHSVTEHERATHREIAGLEKTIVRLQQERVESAQKAKMLERDLDSKGEAMALLEEEITRLKDLHAVELSTQNERHLEALAALKRTLAEKDRHLKHLTSESVEPLQKLRRQLDDERSKRANLEQQLTAHKRMAREAEEESRRELRREQLRPRHQSPPVSRAVGASATSTTAAASSITAAIRDRFPEDQHTDTSASLLAAQHASEGVHTSEQQASHVHVANAEVPTPTWAEPTPLVAPVSSMLPQPRTDSPAKTPPPARNVVTPPMHVEHQPATPRRSTSVEHAQAQHEHKLSLFQSASQDVFERIMGSQKQFWQRCTDVVRAGPSAARSLRVATAISQRSRGEAATGNVGTEPIPAPGDASDTE